MNSVKNIYNLIWAISLISLTTSLPAETISKNGFDLTRALIPPDQIHHGGPPKDGIPAIDHPRFVDTRSAHHLNPDDRIIGVVIKGVARAYPIRILNWHEVVNDSVKDQSFVVTFCPLCGTGIVFEADLQNKAPLTFGVSGLLYNSDVLLYDRQTQSLWSQIAGKAISGKMKGTRLKRLPAQHTSWESWKEQYPQTQILSFNTGILRDYQRNPYKNYEENRQLYFPVAHQDNQYHYHPKERIIGLEINGQFKAYPFIELEQQGLKAFNDTFGDKTLIIKWDSRHSTGQVFDNQGKEIPTIISFWFAWYAFHPDTKVFQSP